jgi:hypothetical protein
MCMPVSSIVARYKPLYIGYPETGSPTGIG